MSKHPNHRRGQDRRTENGPRYENPNPGKGSNATHVARARRKWKRRNARVERRRDRKIAATPRPADVADPHQVEEALLTLGDYDLTDDYWEEDDMPSPYSSRAEPLRISFLDVVRIAA